MSTVAPNDSTYDKILTLLRTDRDIVMYLHNADKARDDGILGRGAYGTCYVGLRLRKNLPLEQVCVKVIAHDPSGSEGAEKAARIVERTRQAFAIAAQVAPGHMRILFETPSVSYCVMGLAVGTMGYFRERLGESPQRQLKIASFVHAIGRDLQDLHAEGIGHYDVKLENCLIENGVPRLRDYDLARPFDADPPTGNFGYDAPERVFTPNAASFAAWPVRAPRDPLQARQRRPKTDIYAFGHTIAQLFGIQLNAGWGAEYFIEREKARSGATTVSLGSTASTANIFETWHAVRQLPMPFGDIITSMTALDPDARPDISRVLRSLEQYHPACCSKASFGDETLSDRQGTLADRLHWIRSHDAFAGWWTVTPRAISSTFDYMKDLRISSPVPARAPQQAAAVHDDNAELRQLLAIQAKSREALEIAAQKDIEPRVKRLEAQLERNDDERRALWREISGLRADRDGLLAERNHFANRLESVEKELQSLRAQHSNANALQTYVRMQLAPQFSVVPDFVRQARQQQPRVGHVDQPVRQTMPHTEELLGSSLIAPPQKKKTKCLWRNK